MEKPDIPRRVTKVTLELMDGTVESFQINKDDGMFCILLSKKQDFDRNTGYCGSDLELQLRLLERVIQFAQSLRKAISVERWMDKRQN